MEAQREVSVVLPARGIAPIVKRKGPHPTSIVSPLKFGEEERGVQLAEFDNIGTLFS